MLTYIRQTTVMPQLNRTSKYPPASLIHPPSYIQSVDKHHLGLDLGLGWHIKKYNAWDSFIVLGWRGEWMVGWGVDGTDGDIYAVCIHSFTLSHCAFCLLIYNFGFELVWVGGRGRAFGLGGDAGEHTYGMDGMRWVMMAGMAYDKWNCNRCFLNNCELLLLWGCMWFLWDVCEIYDLWIRRRVFGVGFGSSGDWRKDFCETISCYNRLNCCLGTTWISRQL